MFMLDTDICIYIKKRNPITVLRRLKRLSVGDVVISSITYGELMHGALKSQHIEKNLSTIQRFTEMIPVQAFDKSAGEAYGRIRSTLEKQGKIIGSNDLLIAAHALSSEYTLVTNNAREFKRVKGLLLDNWV